MAIEVSDYYLAHEQRHHLGEGTIFNPLDERFYYVDINCHKIFAYEPRAAKLEEVADVGEHVSGLAINQDGSLIVARKSGIYYYNDKQEPHWLKVCELEPDQPQNRPNDTTIVACADGSVRFFVGTMPLKNQPLPDGSGSGSLYVLTPDMALKKLAGDLVTTNGLAGFADDNGQTQLFYADTKKQVVRRAVFSPRLNALIGPSEVYLDMHDMVGRPDGGGLLQVDTGNGPQLCYGITAIDSNRVLAFDAHQAVASVPKAIINLDPALKDPTKFAVGEIDGEGTMLVTSFDREPNSEDNSRAAGKVYAVRLPKTIHAVETPLATYPSFEQMKARMSHLTASNPRER
ncbi:MAG: SMP-30/gluconolactonase/LRE family protein [Rickettsiales bacterium]